MRKLIGLSFLAFLMLLAACTDNKQSADRMMIVQSIDDSTALYFFGYETNLESIKDTIESRNYRFASRSELKLFKKRSSFMPILINNQDQIVPIVALMHSGFQKLNINGQECGVRWYLCAKLTLDTAKESIKEMDLPPNGKYDCWFLAVKK